MAENKSDPTLNALVLGKNYGHNFSGDPKVHHFADSLTRVHSLFLWNFPYIQYIFSSCFNFDRHIQDWGAGAAFFVTLRAGTGAVCKRRKNQEPEPLQHKTKEPEPQKLCGSYTSSWKIKRKGNKLLIYYFSSAKIGSFFSFQKDSFFFIFFAVYISSLFWKKGKKTIFPNLTIKQEPELVKESM